MSHVKTGNHLLYVKVRDRKYHILHDLRTFTLFKKKSSDHFEDL